MSVLKFRQDGFFYTKRASVGLPVISALGSDPFHLAFFGHCEWIPACAGMSNKE